MKLVTQQDVQEILPKWSPEKRTSVIGNGLSLRDFVAHPEVKEDEAHIVAFYNSSLGVSSLVIKGFITRLVARVVPVLKASELQEVQDFHQRWAESLPAIPGKDEKVSSEFEREIQYVSHVAYLEGDWLSHLAMQVILLAYTTYMFHRYVCSVCVAARLIYTGNPDGWITERNQQYKDLVTLINEIGE
jgi:hypothetical protein